MNKAFNKYKGIKWRNCGFKKTKKHCTYSQWLYSQKESLIFDCLGKTKGKLFMKGGSLSLTGCAV